MKRILNFEEFINEGYFRIPNEDLGIKDLESFGNVSLVKGKEIPINEGNYSYPPDLEKEFLKELSPLINAYDIDVIGVKPSFSGKPYLVITYYGLVINKDFLIGSFFSEKDAKIAQDFFNKSELTSVLEVDAFVKKIAGFELSLNDLSIFARMKKLNINFDAIKEKDKEWRSSYYGKA